MITTSDRYLGCLLGGRYEITDIIGEGGMAVVYKARCNRLNRLVAVKILREDMAKDEEFKQRFSAESQAIALLNHPNIVSVFDVGHNEDCEYIVMELIDGITLKQYIDRKGSLNWREALHFAKQIAAAMSHAHNRGIVHRDIKPQNVMLLRDGTIKVGDFGIAALESELHENNNVTIGSIHYMSPEQARGEQAGPQADVYSLGIVLYEMLTGRLPFTGETAGEIAVKHMNAVPVPIQDITPEVPEELVRITMKAMNPELVDRYLSADAMIEDLDAFANGVSAGRPPETAEASPSAPDVIPVRSLSELSGAAFRRRRKRSGRVTYYSGTFLAFALCLFLFVFLWRFWMRDIFSPAERIQMPSFVNMSAESVVNSAELYSMYSFHVSYECNDSVPSGYIISQSPESGRSVMQLKGGIDVKLVVSKGSAECYVPDVTGWEYHAAINELQLAGFQFEVKNAVSDSIPADCVLSTSPSAGTMLENGAVVYVSVSAGTEIDSYPMPNVVGMTENEAISKLQSSGLTYGGCERVQSEYPVGTVIGQSPDAFDTVQEHGIVILRISAGNG